MKQKTKKKSKTIMEHPMIAIAICTAAMIYFIEANYNLFWLLGILTLTSLYMTFVPDDEKEKSRR